MINRYATKTDINGNTYKLIIDAGRQIYSRENSGFFHRSDFVTVTKRDYRKLLEEAKTAGYQEVSCI